MKWLRKRLSSTHYLVPKDPIQNLKPLCVLLEGLESTTTEGEALDAYVPYIAYLVKEIGKTAAAEQARATPQKPTAQPDPVFSFEGKNYPLEQLTGEQVREATRVLRGSVTHEEAIDIVICQVAWAAGLTPEDVAAFSTFREVWSAWLRLVSSAGISP